MFHVSICQFLSLLTQNNWHQLGMSWWVPLLGHTPLSLQHTDLCFNNCSSDPLQCRSGTYIKNFSSKFSTKWRRRQEKSFQIFIWFFRLFGHMLSRRNFVQVLLLSSKMWQNNNQIAKLKGSYLESRYYLATFQRFGSLRPLSPFKTQIRSVYPRSGENCWKQP